VLAEQVMQAVPAAGGLGQQVLIIKALKVPARLVQAGVIQRSRGIGVDAGARVQAEAAEQPLLPGGQVLVGQVEGGGDRQVLGAHHGEPVPGSGQVGGQARRGPRRVVVQLAGEHPDRQRQVPAQPGDLPGRGRAGPGAQIGAAGQAGQQRRGVTGRQGVQADRRGVLQRGQSPPAGDQHQAARGAGQQRPDLLMPRRIIDQQQDFLARHVITPPARPGLQPGRDLLCGDPGGQQ
jgi:hypothetical protein